MLALSYHIHMRALYKHIIPFLILFSMLHCLLITQALFATNIQRLNPIIQNATNTIQLSQYYTNSTLTTPQYTLNDISLYFENRTELASKNTRFAQLIQVQNILYVFYQRFFTQTNTMHIIMRSSQDYGQSWSEEHTIGQPIAYYTNLPPQIYHVNTSSYTHDIIVSIIIDNNMLQLYRKSKSEKKFHLLQTITLPEGSVNPKIYAHNYSWVLLITQQINQEFHILYTRSHDAVTWTPFISLPRVNENIHIAITPHFAFTSIRQYVVFSAIYEQDSVLSYQIYTIYSPNNGITWSKPHIISDFFFREEARGFTEYDNFRPSITTASNNNLYVTWERSLKNIGTPWIAIQEINANGHAVDEATTLSKDQTPSFNPHIIINNAEKMVFWFENPFIHGEIYMSLFMPEDKTWKTSLISSFNSTALYPVAQLINNRWFYIMWHTRATVQSTESNIMHIRPDVSVEPPIVYSDNYTIGTQSNQSNINYTITLPQDTAGLTSLSYQWLSPQKTIINQNTIPLQARNTNKIIHLTTEAPSDGRWTLHVSAHDAAGNISNTVVTPYFRDTIAPHAVSIDTPTTDDTDMLTTNSPTFTWQAHTDDTDIAGYYAQYYYTSYTTDNFYGYNSYNTDTILSRTQLHKKPQLSLTNIPNGQWILQVQAQDIAGNLSAIETLSFNTNKFVPETKITSVSFEYDALLQGHVSLWGSGFTDDGTITHIYFDRDNQEPYDYVFTVENNDFRIINNRFISNLIFKKIPITGVLYISLYHEDRGYYSSPFTITVQQLGTVKISNYFTHLIKYIITTYKRFTNSTIFTILALLLLIILCIIVYVLYKIVHENKRIEFIVMAFLQGKKLHNIHKRIPLLHKKQLGLRLKFISFITSLIIIVVLLISIPLSSYILNSHKELMIKGLLDRLTVLANSIEKGAQPLLRAPEANTIELANLTLQSNAMDEVTFITITSKGSNNDNYNTVWASNDPTINTTSTTITTFDTSYKRTINTDSLLPGISILNDPLVEPLRTLKEQYDIQAREQLGTLPQDYDSFGTEIRALILNTSTQAAQRRQEVDRARSTLNAQINKILTTISQQLQSTPYFDPLTLNMKQNFYIFYKPIYFRVANENLPSAQYYRGFIRIGVNTHNIIQAVKTVSQEIMKQIVLFMIVALIGGIIGAIILANIIIKPIKTLVKSIEIIRDTDNKQHLRGYTIPLSTNDELQLLAQVIDQMIVGLVHAADETAEVMVGKDIQAQFISLDLASDNKTKSTTGHYESEFVEFFGYYEGAKGVSGDYFYYEKIDSQHYIMIKCDVAGKGIPASLIMVEVATLFLDYFKDWEKKTIIRKRNFQAQNKPFTWDGILTDLVYSINDLIAEREFKARFAALNIIMYNENNGHCRICNAGDTLLHIYRTQEQQVEQFLLNRCPAAGMFSSRDQYVPTPKFIEEHIYLQPGDFLLLFTDGIEEGKRTQYTPDFTIRTGIVQNQHGKNEQITYDEEFSLQRITDIVHSVQMRQQYILHKENNPVDETLLFDFSQTNATLQETVLALIAVEKIFRQIPHPKNTENDRINIDKKIDDFLIKTFSLYRRYFSYNLKEETTALYNRYGYMKEDAQYDDLTILSMMRKK